MMPMRNVTNSLFHWQSKMIIAVLFWTFEMAKLSWILDYPSVSRRFGTRRLNTCNDLMRSNQFSAFQFGIGHAAVSGTTIYVSKIHNHFLSHRKRWCGHKRFLSSLPRWPVWYFYVLIFCAWWLLSNFLFVQCVLHQSMSTIENGMNGDRQKTKKITFFNQFMNIYKISKSFVVWFWAWINAFGLSMFVSGNCLFQSMLRFSTDCCLFKSRLKYNKKVTKFVFQLATKLPW